MKPMTVKEFDNLCKKDFDNGAVKHSIRIALEKVKKLEHHKDTTVGLWATDRPDIIPKELIKDYFFQIDY